MKISAFQKKIYEYYKAQKRPLPWRSTRDPYKILVSEVMLQQTQSRRVIPKYHEFLKQFPTVQVLAKADTAKLLKVWQGLGYNRRALYLKNTALAITKNYKGIFPKTFETLCTLPGIGPYTAGAIMAFAYNKKTMMIETNIRAVFLHFFFLDKKDIPDKALIPYIEKSLPDRGVREWYNALMDYGAMLKATKINPSRQSKHHVKQSAFKGSLRQIRGAIIREYTKGIIKKSALIRILPYDEIIVATEYDKLKKEGFFR